MCLHETIQLSQDGERVILCGDCGRKFGLLASDERETFNAYIGSENPVVLLPGGEDSPMGMVVTVGAGGNFHMTPIYPCRECRWLGSCEEGCHT